jgi:hypothetical protein
MNLEKLKNDIEQQTEKVLADNPEMSSKNCQIIAMFQAAYGATPDLRLKPSDRAKGDIILPLILEAMEMSRNEWSQRLSVV